MPLFMFPYIGNNHPNWLIFFRGVQTTNQISMTSRQPRRCWNGPKKVTGRQLHLQRQRYKASRRSWLIQRSLEGGLYAACRQVTWREKMEGKRWGNHVEPHFFIFFLGAGLAQVCEHLEKAHLKFGVRSEFETIYIAFGLFRECWSLLDLWCHPRSCSNHRRKCCLSM